MTRTSVQKFNFNDLQFFPDRPYHSRPTKRPLNEIPSSLQIRKGFRATCREHNHSPRKKARVQSRDKPRPRIRRRVNVNTRPPRRLQQRPPPALPCRLTGDKLIFPPLPWG